MFITIELDQAGVDVSVVIARSLELMPPHGQKAGLMVVYVLCTWGI